MPDRNSSSTSNSSRTAAKVAVAVLIVIAIAGFVLAGLKTGKSAPEQVAAADPTQEPAVAPTAAAAPAAPDEPALPGHVVAFPPSSANLGEKELAKVRTMAETAKKKNREVQIVSTAEASQFGLAQQRANLVRQTLEQGGVPLARMTIKISQVPHGTVSATEANRVAMVLQ
jgi:outer membrane protein OmpA-like peptidoglycan-associated protein